MPGRLSDEGRDTLPLDPWNAGWWCAVAPPDSIGRQGPPYQGPHPPLPTTLLWCASGTREVLVRARGADCIVMA